MRYKISVAIVIVLAVMSLIAVVSKTNTETELLQLNLQTKDQQLEILQSQKETINQELEDAKGDSKKLKELEKKNQELQKALEDAQARKAEELRIAQAEASNVAQASSQAVTGSKADWLKASGIPESHWPLVDQIVQKESGWNPNAVNASSGACGLGQQLPCGKWAGEWNDPVAALRAMQEYVDGRYGGWQGAWDFWQANRWY
jgi:hypothetical protein